MKGSQIRALSPWSKLHPPLPRTPRQSQQLLNALTSSFRRQLDHEFPAAAAPGCDTPDGAGRLNGNSHSSAYAADKHLRTILENPLFSVSPSKSARSRNPVVLGDIDQQRWAKEPMVVFDELVASGSVTASALTVCLKSQLLLTSPHTGEGFVKAMRDSQAGSKVVTWWFASDAETRKALFRSDAALPSLLKFLVAEELHATVFVWLRMLARCDIGGLDGHISDADAQQQFAKLLVYFLEAEIQYGGGLGSSVHCYLRACKVYNELSNLPQKPALFRPGARLCQQIMTNTPDHAKSVPVHLYEEYMGVISSLSPKSSLHASVSLYHPTRPDTTPLLRFVNSLPPRKFESWSTTMQESFMRACFDALRILVDAGNLKDCSHLARFMQQKLQGNLETSVSNQSGYHASTEEEDLLARLDLALT